MKTPVWGTKANGADKETAPNESGKEFVVVPLNELPQGMAMGPQVVEVVENTIYFYAEVDRDNVLKLNKTLHEMNNQHLWKAQITKSHPADIFLHINSFGGSIYDAFSTVDSILESKVPVNTVIDGCAASAATLLSVVGHKRYIKKHSRFLIHQLSSMMWGKYAEFQDEMVNLDKSMQMIKGLYKQHTKIKMSTLNEILKHDLWFEAKEALQYGLVDEIL